MELWERGSFRCLLLTTQALSLSKNIIHDTLLIPIYNNAHQPTLTRRLALGWLKLVIPSPLVQTTAVDLFLSEIRGLSCQSGSDLTLKI